MSNHPALQLLIGFCSLLGAGVPVGAWFLMVDRRDALARLWFLGLGVNAVGVLGVAVLQRSSFITSSAMPIALVLLCEALRREYSDRPTPWAWLLPMFAAYIALQIGLEATGLRLTLAFMITAFLLAAFQLLVLWHIYRLTGLQTSRGLVLVAIGLVPAAVVNVARFVASLIHHQGDHILSFYWLSNLSVMTMTIAVLTCTIGYTGFMLEKAHRRHIADIEVTARAEERQRLARAQADELKDLVRQRDEMIMANSRFSAVNSLAIFNSAIVHEISQPLQALNSMLEVQAIRARQADPALRSGVVEIQRLVGKLGATLDSFRRLMGAKDPAVEEVNAVHALAEIVPILEAQARRQQVSLRWERTQGDAELVVSVNRLLLERLVFNLVGNALEALAGKGNEAQAMEGKHRGASPCVVLSVRGDEMQGCPYAVIKVSDNGPGFSGALLSHISVPLTTTKPLGLGLGLSLARVIVESWRGQLKVWNKTFHEGDGACVELWVPVRQVSGLKGLNDGD